MHFLLPLAHGWGGCAFVPGQAPFLAHVPAPFCFLEIYHFEMKHFFALPGLHSLGCATVRSLYYRIGRGVRSEMLPVKDLIVKLEEGYGGALILLTGK